MVIVTRRWSFVMLMIVFVATITPVSAEARCFAETGNCLDGLFRTYWERNGGLAVFGLPVTAQTAEAQRDNGQTYQTQWMERNRFELHPENQAPYDVLLGRLGDDRLRQTGIDWHTLPKPDANSPHYFAASGHAIAHDPFWQYWSSHGLDLGDSGISERESLALFGLPLTMPQVQTNSSGDTVLTQWFERARFEDHGAKGVLLGLLGNEVRAGAQPAPASPAPVPVPPTPPTPRCTDVPPGQAAQISPACAYGGDRLTLTGQQLEPGESVAVYVTTPSGSTIEFPVIRGPRWVDRQGSYSVEGALGGQSTPGVYGITIEGRTSGRKAIAFVKLLPADPAVPRQDHSLLPTAQNATAYPASGAIGTVFTFSTTGFQPGTRVGIYATAPDGSVIGAPFETNADGNGNAANRVEFHSDDGEVTQVGVYATTFESVDRSHRAILYFRILP